MDRSTIAHLYRYPVKGLSPEALTRVTLKREEGFPKDRIYALTNGSWIFDPRDLKVRPKTDFLMLAKHEQLAQLKTAVSEDSEVLTVSRDGETLLRASLAAEQGRASIEQFFTRFMGSAITGEPRVAFAHGHQFTDVSVLSPEMMRSISVINLASVRALSVKLGVTLDPMRFRANVYYEGTEPWEELEWLDQEIMLGSLRAKVLARTPRCTATNVNPQTAIRDQTIPQSIRQHYGHSDLGVYVQALTDAEVQIGDRVALLS